MSFTELAPELIHQIYNSLTTISDVINLSLTCHRLNHLLKHAQKLSTLFAAAEREFGPVEDIIQLVTYNSTQPVHLKRDPAYSYSLLRQVIHVGSVAKKIEDIYPTKRWQDDFLHRRSLRQHESYSLRRAVYRFWLYCEAFHNRAHPRSSRMHPRVLEERAQLLRLWSSAELFEIEDLRIVLEDLVQFDLCPTDGSVCYHLKDLRTFNNNHDGHSWYSWPPTNTSSLHRLSHIFYDSRQTDSFSQTTGQHLPVGQRRKLRMIGWGDEITQYDTVQSMMKLNPAQIMSLYDHAVTRAHIEDYISNVVGDDWFWNNGQTFLDTWTLVLHRRGVDPNEARGEIMQGLLGITTNELDQSSRGGSSSPCSF